MLPAREYFFLLLFCLVHPAAAFGACHIFVLFLIVIIHRRTVFCAVEVWACPPVAKKVSGANASDHQGAITFGFGIVDVPWALPALETYFRNDEEKAADSIFNAVDRPPRYEEAQLKGGHSKLEGEEPMHSRFFSAFHKWWCVTMPDSNVVWYHEHRLYTTSTIDMVAFFTSDHPVFCLTPAVLIEFTLESTTAFNKKIAQLHSEARNACHVFSDDLLPAFLGILIDPSTFKFEVHAFHGSSNRQLADILLVRGKKQEVGQLLSMLKEWCSKFISLSRRNQFLTARKKQDTSRLRINKQDGIVLKEFDYRSDITCRGVVHPSDRRVPIPAPLRAAGLLPDARLIVDGENVAVLQYTYMAGGHIAMSSIQFVAIAMQLLQMRKLGFVHGDVRESNIIFDDQGNRANLIDYDMCRCEGSKYISTFNCNIDDGARHPDAIAGGRMEYVHDTFALASIMTLYEVESEESRASWHALINLVEGGKLDNLPQVNVQLVRSKLREECTTDTGSPDRLHCANNLSIMNLRL
jgi:hypothetical protein